MKQNLSFYLLILILLSGLLFSTACNRVKDLILPHTELIFPLEQGRFRITEVIDTTFDTRGAVVDHFYKRERNANTSTDLLDRALTRIEAERSEIEFGDAYRFEPYRVWAQYIDPNAEGTHFAERIQENQRILVLKFPVFPGVSWNGNLFNNQGTEVFRYQEVDTTVVVKGVSYENCVMVVQKADTNGFINFKFAYEIYAPSIGLIKKFDKTLVNDGPNGEFNPDRSRIYIEEIIEHNF